MSRPILYKVSLLGTIMPFPGTASLLLGASHLTPKSFMVNNTYNQDDYRITIIDLDDNSGSDESQVDLV